MSSEMLNTFARCHLLAMRAMLQAGGSLRVPGRTTPTAAAAAAAAVGPLSDAERRKLAGLDAAFIARLSRLIERLPPADASPSTCESSAVRWAKRTRVIPGRGLVEDRAGSEK